MGERRHDLKDLLWSFEELIIVSEFSFQILWDPRFLPISQTVWEKQRVETREDMDSALPLGPGFHPFFHLDPRCWKWAGGEESGGEILVF